MEKRELVRIGGTDIEVLEYNGQRVLTFKQIAEVHGVTTKAVKKLFYKYKSWFVEKEDYFNISKEEVLQYTQLLSVGTRNFGINLITEAGYLLLVKPMQSQESWRVQKELKRIYFIAKKAFEEGKVNTAPQIPHFRFKCFKSNGHHPNPRFEIWTRARNSIDSKTAYITLYNQYKARTGLDLYKEAPKIGLPVLEVAEKYSRGDSPVSIIFELAELAEEIF